MDNSNNIFNSMYYYHQNIHEYNENMRRFLYLTEDERERMNTRTRREYTIPSTNSTVPILNTFMRTYLQNRDNTNVLRYNFEDVVIRPTSRQIDQGTETIICNESHIVYTVCPITLEPFTVGEEMCRIRHCSHIFKKTALMNWFSRNVRCPVCRYDIREYTERNEGDELMNDHVQENIDNDNDDNDENENNDVNESSEFDDIIQELNEEVLQRNNPVTSNTRSRRSNPLLSSLTSVIRSFVQNEIRHLPSHLNNAAELLYTFDIPITFDVSGNEY